MSLRSTLTIPTPEDTPLPTSLSLSDPSSARKPATRKDRRITKKGRDLQRRQRPLRENQTVLRWLPTGEVVVRKVFRVRVLGVDRVVDIAVPVTWKGLGGLVGVVAVGVLGWFGW